jgi:hypothetical protein
MMLNGTRQVQVTYWGKRAVRELRLRGRYTTTTDKESRAIAEDALSDLDRLTARKAS